MCGEKPASKNSLGKSPEAFDLVVCAVYVLFCNVHHALCTVYDFTNQQPCALDTVRFHFNKLDTQYFTTSCCSL